MRRYREGHGEFHNLNFCRSLFCVSIREAGVRRIYFERGLVILGLLREFCEVSFGINTGFDWILSGSLDDIDCSEESLE